MTKYAEKNSFSNDQGTPIPIGSEWTRAERPTYICPYCSRTLQRLTDRSGLSPSYYCSFCSTESHPEKTDLRSKSSIEPQKGGEDNPLASTKFRFPEVGKQHIEPKGTFATLKSKGIRITNYKEEGHIS
jgi:hypothetical protein